MKRFNRDKKYLVIIKEVGTVTIKYEKEVTGTVLNRVISSLEWG